MDAWSAYFTKQDAIRSEYTRKAVDIERNYKALPISTDMIVMMGRLNKMLGEIATVNEQCEAALAKLPKPEGARA